MNLAARFVVLASVLAAIFLGGVAVSVLGLERERLLNESREDATIKAAQLAQNLSAGWRKHGRARPAPALLAGVLALPGFSYMALEDERGRVRFSSSAEPGLRAVVDEGRLDEGAREALGAAGVLLRSRWRNAKKNALTEIVVPVEGPGGRLGALRLALDETQSEAAVRTFARDAAKRVGLIGFWAFLAYFCLAWFFGRRLEAPLWSLHERAKTALKGVAEPEARGAGSLESLASDIEGMARAVDRVDQSRRELLRTLDAEVREHAAVLEKSVSVAMSGAAGQVPPALEQCLALVREQARGFGRLFDNIVCWVEAEHGLLETAPSRVDLRELAEGALAQFEEEARRAGVLLRGEVRSMHAHADPARTRLAISNLVLDAIRSTPSGGEVRMHAARHEGFLRLTVVDGSGAGPRRGPGLGRAVAQAVAESQGGRLTVESPDGDGSIASLFLRSAEAGRGAAAPAVALEG